MADKRRLARWILYQNYDYDFFYNNPYIEILMFDKDDYLYWIDPISNIQVKARLNEPISNNIANIGYSYIGSCYIQ